MKKFKKLFAVMLCLLMMLTPVISDQQAVTVQAATKMTAVKQVKTKSGKRYGYDTKGKMIKNQWGKTSSGCIYYFQKNGAAYQADKDFQGRYGIVIKKIDNKYYGFDVYGHRVTGFHMASTKLYGNAILYYFDTKTGAYNQAKSKVYRTYTVSAISKATKYQKNATKLKKLLGKQVKKVKINKESCFLDGKGWDVTYTYANIELNVFRPYGKGSSAEVVESVVTRF